MLTTTKLKLKIKRFAKSPRIRSDLKKLKDPKIAEVFQAKVGGKFAALCVLDSDVDTLVNSLKKGYSQQLKRYLGDRGEDSTWGHKQGSGSVGPKTAAERTEVHKH